MATLAISPQSAGISLPDGVKFFSWGPLTSTDLDGAWLMVGQYADISMHIYGTYGTATLVIQGSNEFGTPASPATLTDQSDNALSFTSASGNKVETIMQSALQIRPVVTGADGTTSLTVALKLVTSARR